MLVADPFRVNGLVHEKEAEPPNGTPFAEVLLYVTVPFLNEVKVAQNISENKKKLCE